MLALADVLPRLGRLKHLSLAGHAVAGYNVELICSALEGLTQLESLDVSGSPLGADGVLRVADAAALLGGLRRLHLNRCYLLPSAPEALLGALPCRGLLQHLHVYFHQFHLLMRLLLAGGSSPSGSNAGAGSIHGSGSDPGGSDTGSSADSESSGWGSDDGHE
jgi:hypothetical protein